MSERKRRWYVVVGVIWFIAVIVASVLFVVFMETIALRGQYELMRVIAGAILISLFLGLLLWVFWVVPLLAVQDMPRRSKLPPAKRTVGMRTFMLMPGILPLILVALWWSLGGFSRNFHFIVWTSVIGMAFAIAGCFLANLSVRRLRAACLFERICFQCGYDLRGSPTLRCPECGYDSGTAAQTVSPQPSDSSSAH